MSKYTCSCCFPSKGYSRSDKLYNHRQKYDPSFVPYTTSLSQRRAEYLERPNSCAAECGNSLPYARRNERFCSKSCSATLNNKTRGSDVICKNCLLNIGKGTGTVYCSRECHNEFSYKENIRKWLGGERTGGSLNGDVATWVRRWLFEKNDSKCQECGWSKVHQTTGKIPLTVDHIDGNSSDHRPENLRLLCPCCHSLTSTYGVLNKGRGRPGRK